MKYLFGAVLMAATVGGCAYYFLAGQTEGDGAGLSFAGPEKIAYGEPFELSVGISNASGAVWKDASVAMSLPDGFVFVDGAGSPSFISRQLGDVGSGSVTQAAFEVIAIRPEDGAPAETGIVAELSYAPQGTSAVFEKSAAWQAPRPEEGVILTVTAPGNVMGGEEFKTVVKYENRGGADIKGLSLGVRYPDSFIPGKASMEAEEEDDEGGVWEIGTLAKGSSDELVLYGRIGEAAKSSFDAGVFRIVRGVRRSIAKAQAPIESASEPIALEIDANDTADYVAKAGDTITYTISYVVENPANVKKAMTISAEPSSPLFDMSSIEAKDGGKVQATSGGQSAIVWNLKPGIEGGSVSFTVKVKPDYGITRLSDRNFIVKMRAEAKLGDIVVAASHEAKVAGQAQVGAKAYFRDAASGIANQGPFPPKVGQATEYTVRWTAKNYATDVQGVTVRGVLGVGVKCTGIVKSTVSAVPVCDAETGQVSWNIGRMSATSGVLSNPPEAIFQVRLTPTGDMAGKSTMLVGPTTLVATDAFTAIALSSQAPELSTLLPDDPTASGQGIVAR